VRLSAVATQSDGRGVVVGEQGRGLWGDDAASRSGPANASIAEVDCQTVSTRISTALSAGRVRTADEDIGEFSESGEDLAGEMAQVRPRLSICRAGGPERTII